MNCPGCNGEGTVQAPYSSPAPCPWCEGTGRLAMLPPSARPYPYGGCCSLAVVLPRQCVCTAVTWCPQHGRRCNGTHD